MKLCGKAGKLHLLHCKRNIPLMLLEWVFKSTRKTSNDFSYDLRSKLFLINQNEACNTVDPLYNILCFGVPPPQLQFVAFKWLPSNFVLTYKNFVLCTFSKKKKCLALHDKLYFSLHSKLLWLLCDLFCYLNIIKLHCDSFDVSMFCDDQLDSFQFILCYCSNGKSEQKRILVYFQLSSFGLWLVTLFYKITHMLPQQFLKKS